MSETHESKVKRGAIPADDHHVLHGTATLPRSARLNLMRDAFYQNSVEHGFWEGYGDWDAPGSVIPEKLMLIVTEAAEAMEAYREKGHVPGGLVWVGEGGKPEGIPFELADIIIRVLDLAGALGIDIERAVFEKHQYNLKRPYRHGGKLA